jgi:hypothetical protein
MCEYEYNDCLNEGKKCHLCCDGYYYTPPKQKAHTVKMAKSNGRKGSQFEADNHNGNALLLSGASSRLTPNSGAGQIKGDEEIRGIISVMEELKERESYNARGEQIFGMEKAWFDKLDREGRAEGKEFWYLKFMYKNDSNCYVAMRDDMVMSMVYTMSEDRKAKLQAELELNMAKARIKALEKEAAKLHSEVQSWEMKERWKNTDNFR